MMEALVCLALSTFMIPPADLNFDFEQDGVLADPIFAEHDGLLADLDDDVYDELAAQEAELVAEFVGSLGPVEHDEQLALMKASHGIPSEPRGGHDFYTLPDSTRDQRHASDEYPWHYYYHMSNVSESKSSSPYLNISLTGGNLHLLSPRRGMSMRFNCLIEVDIRVKAIGDDDTADQTVADGCMEFIEDRVCFEELLGCDMTGPYGSVAFDYIIFREGFEATIELNFLEVPEGGFNIQMCGYTTIQKNYYTFIGNNCECDSFISSTGIFPHYFIAALQKDDYFLVDFAEGRSPLVFKPSIHGSEEKEYSFHNGALVSVKLSWSTTFYC